MAYIFVRYFTFVTDGEGYPMLEPTCTAKEVAALLRLSERSICDARFRQRIGLRAVRIGRSLRFLESDIRRILHPDPPVPPERES